MSSHNVRAYLKARVVAIFHITPIEFALVIYINKMRTARYILAKHFSYDKKKFALPTVSAVKKLVNTKSDAQHHHMCIDPRTTNRVWWWDRYSGG